MKRTASRPLLVDLAPSVANFRDDVRHGLSRPHKSIPPKYFYDARGAALFEGICELPEYYLTRAETAIFATRGREIAQAIGENAHLVEYGSGNSRKTRLLLDALTAPAVYMPVDLSAEHMLAAARDLARDYPALEVAAVVADFSGAFALPAPRRKAAAPTGLFLGSSIGNFAPADALAFLRQAARLLAGGAMLVGVDLKKDPARLNAAYDDAAGVTAAFNLNLLARINRELGGTFDLDRFAHCAFYDPAAGRIEMHLVSRVRQTVRIGSDSFAFDAGETIHTENSYKYSVEEFRLLAAQSGFTPSAVWLDPDGLFSLHFLRA